MNLQPNRQKHAHRNYYKFHSQFLLQFTTNSGRRDAGPAVTAFGFIALKKKVF